MKIIEQPNYAAMSQCAAEHFRAAIAHHREALVCFSTGGSPRRMYEILANDPVIHGSAIRALALDEWHGISEMHPASCRYFLEQNIFHPWAIPESRQYTFNAAAEDPAGECERMAAVLNREGPIDLCVLGLGRNGHLGLNEPSETLLPHAHVAELDPTSRTHSMLANEGLRLDRGLTFGMADILRSREILLLICGTGKQDAVRRLLQGGVTTRQPASFLWLHANTTVILDASILTNL